MSDNRFCRDCKHAKRTWGDIIVFGGSWEYAKCHHPLALGGNISTNPVTGKSTTPTPYHCSVNRSYTPCGPQGALWESRS
jgi:hypothetical protein